MVFAVARISSRCRVRQVRGNGDDRVLGALFRRCLLMDAEDAVQQRDLIHCSDEEVGTVAQHGAADLGADDRLLDQDLAVVLPCCRDGRVQLVGATRPSSRRRTSPNAPASRRPGTANSFGAAVSAPSSTENAGVSIPAFRATTYASDLSMQIAELWMSQPTYGIPDSSSSPCTAPSSPVLPCKTGNTASMCTARRLAVARRRAVRGSLDPARSRLVGPCRRPMPGAAARTSSRRRVLVMPM